MLVQCAHSQKVSRGRSTIASQVNMARTSAVESANATRHARPQLAAVPPGCRDTLAHLPSEKILGEGTATSLAMKPITSVLLKSFYCFIL